MNSYREKVLLHMCCAPCATHCVEALRAEGFEPVLFFSNSNISPPDEYRKRLDTARQYSRIASVQLIEDSYLPEEWRKAVAGFENEREGGARCSLCFAHNLRRTSFCAARLGFRLFTTTLTVSPHKRSETVFAAAKTAAAEVRSLRAGTGIEFLERNFKKQGGFLHSVELSARYGLYRQNYCGCSFSIRTAPAAAVQ